MHYTKSVKYHVWAALLFPLSFMMTFSCAKDGGLPPVINFDESIYTVKAGKEITIDPKVENGENAVYEWKTEDSVLSDESVFRHVFKEPGSIYVMLTVTNDAGNDSEEIRIDVAELLVPVISLNVPEGGYNIPSGSTLEIIPVVKNGENASYSWSLEGKEVSTETTYVFTGEKLGTYSMSLTVGNEDGSDTESFTINVLNPSEIPFEWTFESDTYNVAEGRSIKLRPYGIKNADGAVYTWKINGSEVQSGDDPGYVFTAPEYTGSEQDRHIATVTMSNGHTTVSKELAINVCPPEGTYKRPSTGNPSWDRVYCYVPAPGQFINEGYTAATMEEAIRHAEERLSAGQYVSLGGFGGYIVLGFDHSIENSGDYDFAITGNSYQGSSEPGIVWVMQDENGDGQPNDTWYELKGSEYGKPETLADYEVTYYRPSAPGMPVQWTDNLGNTGTIDYMSGVHTQDCYYPSWIEEDSFTLIGTRLAANTEESGPNYWINHEYEWGYADNFSPIDRTGIDGSGTMTDGAMTDGAVSDGNGTAANGNGSTNRFRISDAVTFDGKPASLAYIDFIKICTGVNAKAGWIGEISTEICGAAEIVQ